jgi:hypothetical protein
MGTLGRWPTLLAPEKQLDDAELSNKLHDLAEECIAVRDAIRGTTDMARIWKFGRS